MHRLVFIFLTCFVTACSSPQNVQAKPSAPVKIEYSVPKDVQSGEEVTTVIRFTAETDLQRMEVSASAWRGVELLSSDEANVFEGLKRGDSREFEVRVRLTDEELGYLSVVATTISTLGSTRTKTTAIPYGTAGAITQQKLESPNLQEGADGERLILQPGSPR
jgi:hypothetical protein